MRISDWSSDVCSSDLYYMTKQLLFAQDKASFIYGTYTAMAYFTPILGGAIADRWLGKRNAVVLGGSIMAIGHFVMAFEPMFYFALATIALGNRSEEHTSELQSLMRISYAVFCLKKKNVIKKR